MGPKFNAFLAKVNEIHDLSKTLMLLGWDREVNMPPAGAAIRTQQIATLSRLVHSYSTSDAYGELLQGAADEAAAAGIEPGSFEESLLRYLTREFDEQRRIPEDYVRRVSEANGRALPAWKQARAENDFPRFAPHLAEIVELTREQIEYHGYQDEKYDALLNQYERGMKTADVRAIFEAVKEETVPLIQAIAGRHEAVDDRFLHQPFAIETQKQIAPYFAQAVSYEFEKGHIGTATHPFATSFSRDDARITTRWYPDFLNPFLFGTMHECGHAMYEQNTGPELARTPLARGVSMGFHESQSRMFENLIGRSRGFWQAHFHVLQKAFPSQLGEVTVEAFYRGINKVAPTFIRVEADELTYNMHIILRFELEQALLEGDLAVADVPAAWNDKMQNLLGVIPPTDSEGCLQDIHWTRPSFGYFPTYALGNFYSVQILDAAREQEPEITAELERGEVSTLKRWLVEKIHRHGKKFDPPELMERVTGRPLSHKPFVAYATAKFGEIYGL